MAFGIDPIRDWRDVGLDRYQATMGEYLSSVADEAWLSNPVPSLLRWQEYNVARYGAAGASPELWAAKKFRELLGLDTSAFEPATRYMTKAAANERGKPYGLKFDEDVPEGYLELLIEHGKRRLAHEAVYERARLAGGYGPGKATLSILTEFAVSAVDPLNLLSAFVPVSRVPAVARTLGTIESVGARRVAAGVLEGGVGQALVEPFVAAAALEENPNYGFSHALMDIAFGSALGGGLHYLGGAIGDRVARGAIARDRTAGRGEPPRAPGAGEAVPDRAASATAGAADVTAPPPRPSLIPQRMADAVEAMSPEGRDAVAKTALAQAAADKRIDLDPVAAQDPAFRPPAPKIAPARAVEALRQDIATQEAELARLKAAQHAGAPFTVPESFKPSRADIVAAQKAIAAAKAAAKPPAEPETLAQFVRRMGGINAGSSEAGDLRASGFGALSRLVRKPGKGKILDMQGARQELGRGADEMALVAREAGYFAETPAAADFIAQLIEDASGRAKRYAAPDLGQAVERGAALRAETDRARAGGAAGIDIAGLKPREAAYLASLDPYRRRMVELDDALAKGTLDEAAALERADLIDRGRAMDESDAMADLRAWLDDASEAGDTGLTREEFDALEGHIRDAEEAGRISRLFAGEEAAAGTRGDLGDQPGTRGDRGSPETARDGSGPRQAGSDETVTEDFDPNVLGRGDRVQIFDKSGVALLGQSDPPRYLEAIESGPDGQIQALLRDDAGRLSNWPIDDVAAFGAERPWTDTGAHKQTDLEDWARRQAAPESDAHADFASAKRADAFVEEFGPLTPEKALADMQELAGRDMTPALKAEFDAAGGKALEDAKIIEALAACKLGGGE